MSEAQKEEIKKEIGNNKIIIDLYKKDREELYRDLYDSTAAEYRARCRKRHELKNEIAYLEMENEKLNRELAG